MVMGGKKIIRRKTRCDTEPLAYCITDSTVGCWATTQPCWWFSVTKFFLRFFSSSDLCCSGWCYVKWWFSSLVFAASSRTKKRREIDADTLWTVSPATTASPAESTRRARGPPGLIKSLTCSLYIWSHTHKHTTDIIIWHSCPLVQCRLTIMNIHAVPGTSTFLQKSFRITATTISREHIALLLLKQRCLTNVSKYIRLHSAIILNTSNGLPVKECWTIKTQGTRRFLYRKSLIRCKGWKHRGSHSEAKRQSTELLLQDDQSEDNYR